MRNHPSSILPFLLLIAGVILTGCSQASTPTNSPEVTIQPSESPSEEATEEPTPTLQAIVLVSGDTRISSVDGMEQIYIAEGVFTMGADDDEAKDSACRVNGVACAENPISTIDVPAFWIDKYEVTNSQYSLCVAEGACLAPSLGNGQSAGNPIDDLFLNYYVDPENADHPVVYVDFYMARNYCTWAGRRLPNEREWEKAARGDDARKYPWGNDPVDNDKGNFCDGNCPKEHANNNYDDGFALTAPVGRFPDGASPFGVLDMAGNVWEWVDTIPLPYPYDAEDGREEPDLRTASCFSPTDCPENTARFGDGPERIWRGGTWANGPWWIRTTVRYHSVPGYYHNSLGFRCAQDAQ